MSDDWASYAAARLKDRDEKKRLDDERMLLEENLLKTWGPDLCAQLREYLKSKCLAFNTQNDRSVKLVMLDSSDSVRIYIEHSAAYVTFSFDTDRRRVDLSGSAMASYQIDVAPGSSEVRFADNGRTRTVHEISRFALDHLLGIH